MVLAGFSDAMSGFSDDDDDSDEDRLRELTTRTPISTIVTSTSTTLSIDELLSQKVFVPS